VTATPSAQTTVTTTVPATSVAAPIITNSDPDVNNAKSYVVTFTIGDASRLTQLIDDENQKTMTTWMSGVVGATLAWNSCAWNTTTRKVADVIQNGAVFDNFDTEEYWNNKSMAFIDRFNFFSCRMFYSATTDQDIPLGMAAAQLEEYAWNTATFRPPIVVDGVIYNAVGAGIVSNDTYNVQLSGRMCMGQKADGTYVILAVDGQTNVSGCTIAQVASKMLTLGCENAFNLDGGGSATLWYSGSVINVPSDPGGERAIPAVMYV
jgi:exopolysaccharide biosynthesis protein